MMNATLTELESAGNRLAQAGFMGISSPAAGFVIMLTCQQENLSLIQFQQRYHFQQGRFSMQAHYLLGEFVARGGRYKLIERSPERAALELEKDGNKYLSEVSWAEAQKDTFVYEGGEKNILNMMSAGKRDQLNIKAKYQTPRSRQQMLWARAISDGVVAVDPGCRAAYTTEEVGDIIDAECCASTAEESKPIPAAALAEKLKAKPETPTETAEQFAAPAAQPATNIIALAQQQKAAQDGAVENPELCPVAPKNRADLKGKPWADMDTTFLVSALNAAQNGKYPAITAAHQAAIRTILNNRVDYAKDGK